MWGRFALPHNTTGIGTGGRAWTFDDAAEGVREALGRAGSNGFGVAGRPTWLHEKGGMAARPRTDEIGRTPTGRLPRSERREQ